MSSYIKRPDTVEVWQTNSGEPRPDWVPNYDGFDWLEKKPGQWIVKEYDGRIMFFSDDEFRRLYESTERPEGPFIRQAPAVLVAKGSSR